VPCWSLPFQSLFVSAISSFENKGNSIFGNLHLLKGWLFGMYEDENRHLPRMPAVWVFSMHTYRQILQIL